jgi:hypothetical protein
LFDLIVFALIVVRDLAPAVSQGACTGIDHLKTIVVLGDRASLGRYMPHRRVELSAGEREQ